MVKVFVGQVRNSLREYKAAFAEAKQGRYIVKDEEFILSGTFKSKLTIFFRKHHYEHQNRKAYEKLCEDFEKQNKNDNKDNILDELMLGKKNQEKIQKNYSSLQDSYKSLTQEKKAKLTKDKEYIDKIIEENKQSDTNLKEVKYLKKPIDKHKEDIDALVRIINKENELTENIKNIDKKIKTVDGNIENNGANCYSLIKERISLRKEIEENNKKMQEVKKKETLLQSAEIFIYLDKIIKNDIETTRRLEKENNTYTANTNRNRNISGKNPEKNDKTIFISNKDKDKRYIDSLIKKFFFSKDKDEGKTTRTDTYPDLETIISDCNQLMANNKKTTFVGRISNRTTKIPPAYFDNLQNNGMKGTQSSSDYSATLENRITEENKYKSEMLEKGTELNKRLTNVNNEIKKIEDKNEAEENKKKELQHKKSEITGEEAKNQDKKNKILDEVSDSTLIHDLEKFLLQNANTQKDTIKENNAEENQELNKIESIKSIIEETKSNNAEITSINNEINDKYNSIIKTIKENEDVELSLKYKKMDLSKIIPAPQKNG